MGLLCDKLQIIMTETVSSPASGARSRIAVALALLQGFLIILLCLFAGKLIAAYLPFVFPGTIIGLFILFLLLNMKILPVSRVMDAGAVLTPGVPAGDSGFRCSGCCPDNPGHRGNLSVSCRNPAGEGQKKKSFQKGPEHQSPKT